MEYKKINITTARALYEKHLDFIMVPNKLRPDCFMAANIDCHSFHRLTDTPFDQMVNMFEYYNCNPETGRRVAFYIKVK